MICVICKKGPKDGVSLYRINEKGVPSLCACERHLKQTDGSVDTDLIDLVHKRGGTV